MRREPLPHDKVRLTYPEGAPTPNSDRKIPDHKMLSGWPLRPYVHNQRHLPALYFSGAGPGKTRLLHRKLGVRWMVYLGCRSVQGVIYLQTEMLMLSASRVKRRHTRSERSGGSRKAPSDERIRARARGSAPGGRARHEALGAAVGHPRELP